MPSLSTPCIVIFATSWGSQEGGINSFNHDICVALAFAVEERTRVVCVVDSLTKDRFMAAKRDSVILIAQNDLSSTTASLEVRAEHIVQELKKRNLAPIAWLGHDVITAPIALACAKVKKLPVALFNHMSYFEYQSHKTQDGSIALQKVDEQTKLLSASDFIFPVGPLLRDSCHRIIAGNSNIIVQMVIPGLVDLDPLATAPAKFSGITVGRLNREDDRIKNSRLALASFATACHDAAIRAGSPKSLRSNPSFMMIGLSRNEDEQELRKLASDYSKGKQLNLIAVPFSENRRGIWDHVRSSSFAIMPSLHDGFGLTGWEAIAVGTPLITTKNTGLYQYLYEIGGTALGCISAIEIGGNWTAEEPNRSEEKTGDIRVVADAILNLAGDPMRAKQDALALRSYLQQELELTWESCARTVAKCLNIALKNVSTHLNFSYANLTQTTLQHEDEKSSIFEKIDRTWRPGLGEAGLLRAVEAVVPFHDSRQVERVRLVDWACNKASAFGVSAITGPGGSGKTRLLLEVWTNLHSQGWRGGFLRVHDDSAEMVESLEKNIFFEGQEPLALIIDYAESRVQQIARILADLLSLERTCTVRVFLIARKYGPWIEEVQNLCPSTSTLFEECSSLHRIELFPIGTTRTLALQVFREAFSAFSLKLDHQHDGSDPAFPPGYLSKTGSAHVLELHMAALASLIGQRSMSVSGLLMSTLVREKRYWKRMCEAQGILRSHWLALRQSMASITLFGGAATMTESLAQIRKSPAVSAIPGDSVALDIFSLLRLFYPYEAGVDALRPDRLGEHFVVEEILRDPAFMEALLSEPLTDVQRRSAGIVFGRIVSRRSVSLGERTADLVMKYVNPYRYRVLAAAKAQVDRKANQIAGISVKRIKHATQARGMRCSFEVPSRPSVFSLYASMRNEHQGFCRAVGNPSIDVAVESLRDCYLLLGVIHQLLKPIPRYFMDYIAAPHSTDESKQNCLYTLVMSPNGHPVNVNIFFRLGYIS